MLNFARMSRERAGWGGGGGGGGGCLNGIKTLSFLFRVRFKAY